MPVSVVVCVVPLNVCTFHVVSPLKPVPEKRNPAPLSESPEPRLSLFSPVAPSGKLPVVRTAQRRHPREVPVFILTVILGSCWNSTAALSFDQTALALLAPVLFWTST